MGNVSSLLSSLLWGLGMCGDFDGLALGLDIHEGVGTVLGGLPLTPGPRKYLGEVNVDPGSTLRFGVRFWLRKRRKVPCDSGGCGECGTGVEMASPLLPSASMGVTGAGVSGTEDADAGPGLSLSGVLPIASASSASLESSSDFFTRANKKGLHLSFSGLILVYPFDSHLDRKSVV